MNQNKIKEIIQEAEKHFKTKIPVPTVHFRKMKNVLGYTSFRLNTIAISKDLVEHEFLETILNHELGHHIAFYVYGSNEHCANWFNVCLYLGMDINQIREIYYI